MATDAEFEKALQDMTDAGVAAGKAAGSWVADGNTSEATLRATLRQWEDGDPAAPEAPSPFSGEYAGDRTVEEVIIEETDLYPEDLTPEECGDLADAFEDGYYLGWGDEAERTVRALLGE